MYNNALYSVKSPREGAAVAARTLPVLAAAGYNVYDLVTGDTNIFNSGELGANFLINAGTVGLGSVAGYGAGKYLTPEPDLSYVIDKVDNRNVDVLPNAPYPERGRTIGDHRLRHRRGLYGSAIGAAVTAPFAIGAMRDQPAPISSNIPMQEIQELNDLLEANRPQR